MCRAVPGTAGHLGFLANMNQMLADFLQFLQYPFFQKPPSSSSYNTPFSRSPLPPVPTTPSSPEAVLPQVENHCLTPEVGMCPFCTWSQRLLQGWALDLLWVNEHELWERLYVSSGGGQMAGNKSRMVTKLMRQWYEKQGDSL